MGSRNKWIIAYELIIVGLMVLCLELVISYEATRGDIKNCQVSGIKHLRPEQIKEYCRVSGGLYLKPEEFALYSCGTCYRHMDERLFGNGTKLKWKGKCLINPNTNEKYKASYENDSSPIFATFRTTKLKDLWIRCCQAAVKCCQVMRETPIPTDLNICPRTWDGWNCWQGTPSGVVAQEPCPAYVYFNSDEPHCRRYSTKLCLENATWYRNDRGNEYSDYTECGQSESIKLFLIIHTVTLGISILFLIPALVIFFYYRQLRVYRIFMHKNLFISLLLTAIFVIIFENYVIMDSIRHPEKNILKANQAGCKVFYSLTKYLRLSTYTWMLCEGFYLHKLIAAAFAEQNSTVLYHFIGWGFPAIPVGIWAIIRKLMADESCWTVPGQFEWIMFTPMLLALVVNFCFLAHIIQVIVTKLRSTNADEPTQFRRAVKATMVLIPLFGLHFLLLSYHPVYKDCHLQQAYKIATYLMDGLQGGIVSIIFCYCNNEVLLLLKRSYNRQKMVRDIACQFPSRRTARGSRTSVSTNVDSLAHDYSLAARNSLKK